jgi:CheY-like chemotaxis protein
MTVANSPDNKIQGLKAVPGPADQGDMRSSQVARIVLIVEDHPLIRMGAVQLVEDAGYEAIEAQNADDAIVILETRPDIHLVFTDIEMPGTLDGLKLAHYIRHRWPPILLIVVSGKKLIDPAELPQGARFFAKPYNDNQIVETMRDMFATLDAAA